MKTAIDSCVFSVSSSNPEVYDQDSVRLMYEYAVDLGAKLLKKVLPSMNDDDRYQLAVALTTVFHEGVRLGVEFNRLGGQPPEGPTQ